MSDYNPGGVSVLIVNNERGKSLINMIDINDFALIPADINFIIEHNKMYYLTRNKPLNYNKFCDDLKRVGLHKALINHEGGYFVYYAKKFIRFVKFCVKKIIPSRVKKFIKRKILHRQ